MANKSPSGALTKLCRICDKVLYAVFCPGIGALERRHSSTSGIPLKLVRTFSESMRGSHPDCEAVLEKVFDRANKISCWRLKDLTNSCLPTQLSPPQAWEERPLSPLTLQSSEPARPSAPRKNPWLRAAQRQNFLRQVLVMIG